MTGRLPSSRLHPPRFEVPSDTGWDGKRWTPPDPGHDHLEPAAESDAASRATASADPESTLRTPAPDSAPRSEPWTGAAGGATAADATQVVAPVAAADRATSTATTATHASDSGSDRDGAADGVAAWADEKPTSGAGSPWVNGHDVSPGTDAAAGRRPSGPTRNGHHVNGSQRLAESGDHLRRGPHGAPGAEPPPGAAGPGSSRPGSGGADPTRRVTPPPSASASPDTGRDDDPDRTQVVNGAPRPTAAPPPAPPSPALPPPASAPPASGPPASAPPAAVPPPANRPRSGPAAGPPGPDGAGAGRGWRDEDGWSGVEDARAGSGAELARVRDAPAVPGPAGGVGPARWSAVVLDEAMAQTARETWPPISDADLDVTLAAGDHAHARALTDPRAPVADAAEHAALDAVVDATERAVAVARLGPRHEPGRAPWGRAGLVVPVLGATGGAGASVVAAALFDALDAAGVRTLLVDAADPQRSGLASAARNQGAASRTLHPDVGVAFARRGEGWMAQMAIRHGAVVAGSMVPAPSWWLPDGEDSAPEVTVVDLGWDSWSLAAAPLRGPGAWLEAGSPAPRPVLVVAPTRPCLAQANQLLARLRPWIEAGRVAPMAGLAVVGARRWPRDVPGVAARALGPLLSDAVFLPNDAETRTAGIGPRPLAARLQRSVAPLLADWNLMPARGRAPKRHSVAYRRT